MNFKVRLVNKVETTKFGNITIDIEADVDTARDAARIEDEAKKRAFKTLTTETIMQLAAQLAVEQLMKAKADIDELDEEAYLLPSDIRKALEKLQPNPR